MQETNAELIVRYRHVSLLVAQAKERAERLRPGGARDRAFRWAGCLNFALLQIISKMEDRNIPLLEVECPF